MRKLLVVLSVLFAVALVAGPVFAANMYDPEQRNAKLAEVKASPLKASGEFTFGMLTPFDSDFAGIGFANAYVDFTWYPDEYNSLLMELAFTKEYTQNVNIAGAAVKFPYFELTTDVGKALDLPVGLLNTIGLTSFNTNKFEVSGHAWERTKIRSAIDPVAWKIKADLGKAQITTLIGFGERTNDATAPWSTLPTDATKTTPKGSYNDFGVYAFMPEIGPVQAEAWYLSQNNPDFKGKVGVSVKTNKAFIKEMVTFAGGFMYNMVDNSAAGYAWDGYKTGTLAADDKYWAWGAGAKMNLMGAGIGLSMNGDVMDAFDQLAVDVDYQIKEGPFGVQADAGFTFADVTTSAFLGAEFSVYVKAGGAKWNIGYLLDGDDQDKYGYAYSVAKVNPKSKGGLFVVGDINF
jgi:hypothetical protein